VGARLVGARLVGARLVGARLVGARLVGARLVGAPGLIALRSIAPLLLCQRLLPRFRVGTSFSASVRLPHLWGKVESHPGAQCILTKRYEYHSHFDTFASFPCHGRGAMERSAISPDAPTRKAAP
jgi:Pentapeptide repeats (8 copies)